MQDCLVPNGDQFSDVSAKVIRKMNDATILNIGSRSDNDPIDVRPEDALEPNARFFPERHIADQIGAGSDECAGMNGRFGIEKTRNPFIKSHERQCRARAASINREAACLQDFSRLPKC